MMPGPLLTYVINGSLRRGFIAGPLLVLGHTLLELMLVILMVFGLSKLFANPVFTAVMGLVGGGILLWYSAIAFIVAFGRKILNDSIYRGIILIFGLILIYFAGTFILDGVKYFL